MHAARWARPFYEMAESWITMRLDEDTYVADDATHWMPLPAPPAKGDQ